MAKTIHRNAARERDGFIRTREPKRSARRTGTRRAIIAAELATDRPAVRAALKA
jgi:hypothetical protein